MANDFEHLFLCVFFFAIVNSLWWSGYKFPDIFLHIWFVNIFSPFISCLFILWSMLLESKKILIWMKSILSIFSFMNHTLGVMLKNSFPNARPWRFSSKRSIVLNFTFRFMIHFELILNKELSLVPFFLYVDVHLF